MIRPFLLGMLVPLSLGLLAPGPGWTEGRNPSSLLFLGNKNIAPVVYLDRGHPSGLAVELVRAMEGHLEQPVVVQAMDWAQAQAMVDRGEADVLVQINRTKEREAKYEFSAPLLESRFSVFVRNDTFGVSGIAQLRDRRVGVEPGGLPRQLLGADPEIRLTLIPGFLEGFQALAQGSLDAVVVDQRVGTYVLAVNNMRGIRVTGEPLATSFSAFAVKKGNHALLVRINTALEALKADGTYQKILDRWKPEEVVYQTMDQISRTNLVTLAGGFALVLGLGTLTAVLWTVYRRRQFSLLRGIIDGSDALIFSVDRQYRYTSFNRNHAVLMKALWGRDLRRGLPFNEVGTDPVHRLTFRHNLDRALAGEAFVEEIDLGPDPGDQRSYRVSHSPIFGAGRRTIGVAVFAQDITERRRSVQRLQDSEQRYRQLLGSVTNYIYTVEVRDGVPVSTVHGPGCLPVTGHSAEEFAADPDLWFEMIYEPDRKAVLAHVARIFALEATPPLEHRILHPDGTLRWIRNTCVSHLDDRGQLTAYDGLIADITTEKRSEEAWQRSEKLESIGQLAAGIAHDFNNLLGGIFGYIALARDFGHPGPPVLRYLDKAEAVFFRAKALTRQLLTFTKKNTPQVEVQALGPLVTRAAEFSLSGTNVGLTVDSVPDLWPAEVDGNQWAQAVDNLVLNARQAMPQGGQVTIVLRNALLAEDQVPPLAAGRYLTMDVGDTGVGIPAHLLDRIWDPFFTTKETGHGLGLATTHSIVAKHGGAIQVESEEGRGTRFRVYLPAAEGPVPPPTPVNDAGHRGTGTILVMDDDQDLRDILGTLLTGFGYRILEAGDGSQALDLARAEPQLKAAILDLTIRNGLGGRETLPLLRQVHPGLPAFAVSGYSEDPVLSRPGEFGFTGCLVKPFQRQELAALLEGHLG